MVAFTFIIEIISGVPLKCLVNYINVTGKDPPGRYPQKSGIGNTREHPDQKQAARLSAIA